MELRSRPALVYDGECGLCTRTVRLALHLPATFTVTAWQLADLPALGLTRDQAAGSVQWVEPGGRIASGHEAIAAALRSAGGPWSVIGRILVLRGISPVAGRLYAWVSANRHRLPGGTPACSLPAEQRPHR